tara:strand:- start:5887 stop:6717 length:831 start_codon:yes stop_codon:yes gene_type:complete
MNIVGLGRPGCLIASTFAKYDNYNIFCVDTAKIGQGTFLKVKQQNCHEDYEKNYKKLNFSKCKGETLVILSGAGKISGCVLRILEQLKDESVEVLYVKPGNSKLTGQSFVRDKIVYGVLQEYARSGKIKNVYVVSNNNIESIVGSVSVTDYWNNINNVISSTYHMINVFNNTEPLLKNKLEGPASSRICTLGVVNYRDLDEKIFYDLEFTRVKNYFFGINKSSLEDKGLLTKIKSFIEDKTKKDVVAGYSIYPTDYEENYVYTMHASSFIQEQNLN